MNRSPGLRSAAAAAAAVALCAGWLAAQQLYRGMPFPPELTPAAASQDAARPAEFSLARMAYSDPYPGFHLDLRPWPTDPRDAHERALRRRPWEIDSPASERHFLQGLRRLSAVNARSQEVYVHPDSAEFFDYPFLYVVETGHWQLTDREVENIREYLLRGGFIVFDDFHGSEEWGAFMRGIRRIFPDREVSDIAPGDEIFHVLYDLERREQIPGLQAIFSGRSYERDGKIPHWRGIRGDDGRLMAVINHNMDLGDAWEHADWPEYPERFTAMAYRMGINYIVYAMTH